MTPILVATLALSLQIGSFQDAYFEDFDARGSSWAETIFPDVYIQGGAALSREPLSLGQGAPRTDPPLPINAGGDAEGRFFEATVPGQSSFALTANEPVSVFRDGGIRAFVAFGVTNSIGDQGVGLLLRAWINPPHYHSSGGLNAYTAFLFRNSSPWGTFGIARWQDGAITPDSTLALAEFPFPRDGRLDNYLIEFKVAGTKLTARLWRVTARAGRLVTEPVVFDDSGPAPNQLWAQDGGISAGRAGVEAFTRSTNSVFLDEILVKPSYPGRRGRTSSGSIPFGSQLWLRTGLPWTLRQGARGR